MLRFISFILISGVLLFSNLLSAYADVDDSLILVDFRSSNSTEPYVWNGVDFLKNKTVPSTATWTQSDGSITFYSAFVDLIKKLNDNDYYFVILAQYDESYADISGYSSVIGGYGSFPSLGEYNIYVLDNKKMDGVSLDSFVATYEVLESGSKTLQLKSNDSSNLYFYQNSLNYTFDEWNSRAGFCQGCSFDTFDSAMKDTSNTSELYSSLTLVSDYEQNIQTLPVYSNIPFSFDLGEDVTNNSVAIYNDFRNSPINIFDGAGYRFDSYLYLLNYVTGQDVDPDYDPDNPGEEIPEGPTTQDTILDSNTSGAQDQIGGFFDDFKNDNHGLADIVTAPLYFIKHLLDTTCSPLTFPLPFTDVKGSLPCMSDIYTNYFGDIYLLYQEITTGIIAYWVLANMFRIMKNFKDPENSEIEVMDL